MKGAGDDFFLAINGGSYSTMQWCSPMGGPLGRRAKAQAMNICTPMDHMSHLQSYSSRRFFFTLMTSGAMKSGEPQCWFIRGFSSVKVVATPKSTVERAGNQTKAVLKTLSESHRPVPKKFQAGKS